MTQDERRKVDNLLLSLPLSQVHGRAELQYLATLIQDHDHLREKLMSTTDGDRYGKLEGMRPYLHFEAHTVEWYEDQERRRARGSQPFYQEKIATESRIYPPSVPTHI